MIGIGSAPKVKGKVMIERRVECEAQTVTSKPQDLVGVTFFNDAAAATCTFEQLSLPALRDTILGTTASTKAKLPWLKLAKFGSKRSEGGSLRHNANVLEISGIEADYDGE